MMYFNLETETKALLIAGLEQHELHTWYLWLETTIWAHSLNKKNIT